MPAELSVPQEPIPSEGLADATEEERHFREGDQLSRLNTIAVTSVVSVLATFFVQQVIR